MVKRPPKGGWSGKRRILNRADIRNVIGSSIYQYDHVERFDFNCAI